MTVVPFVKSLTGGAWPARVPVRFTAEDAQAAWEAWGCNCGPGAVAGVFGLTMDEVRAHMGDFEVKRYTNPTLMWDVLGRLGQPWRKVMRPLDWPVLGLARVQWEGPWTEPGVPPAARYRQTHWVGARQRPGGSAEVFDINCMSVGGWVPEETWVNQVVPWLLRECVPRANGTWHLTHAVELAPSIRAPGRGVAEQSPALVAMQS